MQHRIAIIGAGFSGVVLAAHLLRQTAPSDTEVVLIERGHAVGRGVAYAERDWPYLLNVAAGRLSADSRDPLQFLRFARRSKPLADAESFLPRALYGEYLEDFLRRAEQGASASMRLTRICGEVTRLTRNPGSESAHLHLGDGAAMTAAQVVLAVGNPTPGDMPWSHAVRDHAAYRTDPWTCPRDLGADQTVVIIGSGLTMADVAVSLAADLERGPRVISISRHGLVPLPQSRLHGARPAEDVAAAVSGAASIRKLLAIVRKLAYDAGTRGGDWREIITAVRHVAPRVWQQLPQVERRRFLRHLRSHWDVHRHRLPSELASRLDVMRAIGKLEVHAGRIMSIDPRERRLEVTWRARGGERLHIVCADRVVNAIGPQTSLARSPDTLLASLREAGLIGEDALGLGLKTGPVGACIDADDKASDWLFYLGPMLRAAHWEATAAAELRDHAERLAARLLAS